MKDDGRAPWWVVAFAAAGAGGAVAAYFALRTSKALWWHAQLGDALAPVASILSLFAVMAALWSVHVQRQELRDNRRVLEEQRDAQQELASSQRRLADAQEQANAQAIRAEHAQRVATLAQLTAGLDAHAFARAREMTANMARHGQATVQAGGTSGDMNELADREWSLIQKLESEHPELTIPLKGKKDG